MIRTHDFQFAGFVCLILVFISGATVPAQEPPPMDTLGIEKLLTETRIPDCQDYQLNAKRLIPRLHQEQKFDSINALLEFIHERCPTRFYRSYQILRRIQNEAYGPSWCDEDIVEQIVTTGGYFRCGTHLLEAWHLEQPSIAYDSFMINLASQIRVAVDSNSFAHAVATFFSVGRHGVLPKLAAGQYAGSCLQERYDAQLDSLLHQRAGFASNWSINAGTWIPTGNLDLLGIKPEIGGQGGFRWRQVGFDLTMLLRFVNSEEAYRVRHGDSLHETDSYFSVYLGVDPVFRLMTLERTSIELFGGLGYDGIMALTANQLDEEHGDYINSLSVSAGLTWRWFYDNKRTRYFGLQARLSAVDHKTGAGGTNLSGRSISINLIWGSFGYGWVDHSLGDLGYFNRGR